MNKMLVIPSWLDSLLFDKLEAKYEPLFCTNFSAIDWKKEELKCYLGTYFPRSYVESYSLFSRIFKDGIIDFSGRTNLSIYDFATGTGGAVFGFLSAVVEFLPNVASVSVVAHDGNSSALRMFEEIVDAFTENNQLKVSYEIAPVLIDDIQDLSVLGGVSTGQYDVVLTSKAICEFITKNRLAVGEAYSEFVRFFKPKVKNEGFMLLADISTVQAQDTHWLGNLMDKAVKEHKGRVIKRNIGFNEEFCVSHSKKQSDRSKIVWRVVTF